MTNIVKDMFIIPAANTQNAWSWKSTDTEKVSSNFEKKKSRVLIPDKFQEKVTTEIQNNMYYWGLFQFPEIS